jgi:hypothetical protein
MVRRPAKRSWPAACCPGEGGYRAGHASKSGRDCWIWLGWGCCEWIGVASNPEPRQRSGAQCRPFPRGSSRLKGAAMPGRARHTLPGQTHKACLRRTNTPPRQGGGGPDTQSLFAEDQHPSPSRRKGTPVKRLQYHRGPIAGHTIPKLPRAKTPSPSKENETPGTGDLEGL